MDDLGVPLCSETSILKIWTETDLSAWVLECLYMCHPYDSGPIQIQVDIVFYNPDSVLRTFLKQLVTMASGWVGIDEETLLYCYRSYSDVMSCFFLGETVLTSPKTTRSKHIGVYKDDWILLVCHLTSHCGSGGQGAWITWWWLYFLAKNS